MTSKNNELSDEDVDAALSLAVYGFDPTEKYPEWSNTSLREAYRAGWEDRAAEADEDGGDILIAQIRANEGDAAADAAKALYRRKFG